VKSNQRQGQHPKVEYKVERQSDMYMEYTAVNGISHTLFPLVRLHFILIVSCDIYIYIYICKVPKC